MSAIWGYLDLGSNNPDKNKQDINKIKDLMKEPYNNCAIDRFSHIDFEEGFFGCGIQNFNGRADNEELPYCDSENRIVFNADIILNARVELAKELSSVCDKEENELLSLPDGSLAYLAWETWRETFVDHIQGLFAIAIFERDTKTLHIYTDHMGHRCIHYYTDGTRIWYSTLIKPILNTLPSEDIRYCEKWITACESNVSPAAYLFPWLTPYENIYQLVKGSHVKMTPTDRNQINVERVSYWNPVCGKIQLHSAMSKEERDCYYKKQFLDIFFDCVRDAVDTNSNVAATISSGLDSTSVSSIAATILKKQGKILYGFTSVPLPEFENHYDRSVIVDESPYVKKFCKLYENIDPEFVTYEDKSALTELDRLVDITEIPAKALQNLVWIDEIMHKSAEKGCKTLLIGQFGNITISNGSVLSRVYQELRSGHFLEAKNQLAAYGKRYGVTRGNLLAGFLKQTISKVLFDLELDSKYKKDFDSKFLKSKYLRKYKIIKVSRKMDKKNGFGVMVTREQVAGFILDEAFSQSKSTHETKLSLYHGVITRDPTRDKRMAELVMQMPSDQFVDDGLERRLVRKYMEDYVPDFIRNEVFRRGRQAADLETRLKKKGTIHVDEDPNNEIYRYLEYENVQKIFREGVREDNANDILRIMSLESFLNRK